MLISYSLCANGALTTDTLAALRRAERAVAAELLGPGFPDLALGWEDVEPGVVEGTFVRGYARASGRGRSLQLVEALRRLSREFPGISVLFSGFGELPPTTIRAGAFELFEDAYVAALGELHWAERRAS